MSWEMVELGEVCEVVSGATPKREVAAYWGGDIDWVTPKDLTDLDGRFIDEAPEKITEAGYKSCSTHMVPAGSVLLSSRAPIGHLAITRRPVCTNQGFKNFIPGPKVHAEYLYWALKRDVPKLQAMGTGSTFKEISKAQVEKYKIPLPPLPEQRRIAAILDKAQALVANDKRTLAVYDQLAKSLFLEKIGDTISNPKGWPLYELQQLCDMRRGASPRPIDDYMGGTVPWIKIGDCTKGSSIYVDSTAEHVTEEGARRSVLLEPGALILANSGVSLGFARITRIRGCVHDGWLALENIKEERIEKLFLLKVLNSITEYLRKKAPEGTQPNLNTAMMKTFRIPVPPLQVQGAFSKTIEAIDAQALNATTSLHRSEALFGSLLQRAFRGELG